MLDAFEILTTSGIVLWRRHYTPDFSPHVINNLVSDVLIEEKRDLKGSQDGEAKSYRKDRYTLKWTSAKDVGLCFVAVYNALINLSWVDDLLAAVKTLFLKQYGSELKKPDRVHLGTHQFDQTFDALIKRLDTGSTARRQSDSEGPAELTPPSSSAGEEHDTEREEPPPPPPGVLKKATPAVRKDDVVNSSTDATPVVTPDASRPSTPSGHLLQAKSGPGGKTSRRARKAQHLQATPSGTPGTSGDEAASRSTRGKGTAKAKRRWDESGVAVEDTGDDSTLDYSATADAEASTAGNDEDPAEIQNTDSTRMGQRTGKGEFVLKDLDDEIESILAQQSKSSSSTKTKPTPSDPSPILDEEQHHGLIGSTTTRITSLFQNLVGGRTLTKQDLRQPLQQMQNALLQKNVAREAAERLSASVEKDLLDSRTASFTTIDATIRTAMEKALTRMLTPTTSLDLLREITRTTTTNGPAKETPRPYVISIVGVNGVGKSTNLSKIAYFLLQNHFRVLVVAGDTFRSGAVEQLRVHVRNLSELARRERVGRVELFDRGYGGDAAGVAREAIAYASKPAAAGDDGLSWDVVLIDTAGRRHNDSRLMSSLTKFSQMARPDKVFMLGEALVGTDSVAQARNFAREFVDGKGQLRNNGTGLDGFIISKCDTVGDMVGTLVSMVHATGIPVVFLGVGQHYGDLRGLNVRWAVDKLLK
ncbi:P-loop containing nucleoside triphosphate hydrolase protein [Hortaea werneckii]|nr:P-loop containing nucleoside triphosphate hydrolase protein [Hortaea werneckii]